MQTGLYATIAAAALSVSLGLSAAYAQAPSDAAQSGAAPSAPAAQPSSPGSSSGNMSQKRSDMPDAGTSGAATQERTGKQMGERSNEGDVTKPRDREAADSDRNHRSKSAESESKGDRDAPSRDKDGKSAESKSDMDRKSAETREDRMDRDLDRKSAETGDRDRTDRDRKAAERKGATAKIDTNQKQKVRAYFSEHRPTAKRVDKNQVSVSIGVGLPSSIALAPLPPDIVIVAADCPLNYFLWGDDIVLVDSCSREVVDIIPSIG
jgi:hypothetical protein